MVVNELRALVEERGVVFVCLDDEEWVAAQARTRAEVRRHTTNEKTGIETGGLQQPRKDGGRCRLAMRAGHAQHPAIAQHLRCEPFRPGNIGNAAFEQCLDDRLPAHHHVAHHDDIGRGR